MQDFFNMSEKQQSKINIAIDGYSSCGKSTLARDLSAMLSYLYIDSGAMYRATTLYFIQNDIGLSDEAAIKTALETIDIRFNREDNGCITYLNGKNVESDIRSMEVNSWVSQVAAITSVRRALVERQKAFGKDKGVVMDGRDIGTVVFPDAELKIFLHARLEIRVERRYLEILSRDYSVSKPEVEKSIVARDLIDTTREDSPLVRAKDAVVIDNSFLSREDQLKVAYTLAVEKIRKADAAGISK